MTKSVVIDSDAIFAIYNPNDPLNKRATWTFHQLIAQGFSLIYPTSVLFEVISLFQRVLPSSKVTASLIDMIKKDRLPVQIIDSETLKESAGLFDPTGSKKNTLVDCSVVIVARKIKARGVFSYDSFYTKRGLQLAKDLI